MTRIKSKDFDCYDKHSPWCRACDNIRRINDYKRWLSKGLVAKKVGEEEGEG